jgi:hypothetical protein
LSVQPTIENPSRSRIGRDIAPAPTVRAGVPRSTAASQRAHEGRVGAAAAAVGARAAAAEIDRRAAVARPGEGDDLVALEAHEQRVAARLVAERPELLRAFLDRLADRLVHLERVGHDEHPGAELLEGLRLPGVDSRRPRRRRLEAHHLGVALLYAGLVVWLHPQREEAFREVGRLRRFGDGPDRLRSSVGSEEFPHRADDVLDLCFVEFLREHDPERMRAREEHEDALDLDTAGRMTRRRTAEVGLRKERYVPDRVGELHRTTFPDGLPARQEWLGLRLRRVIRAVAQVRDHVRDVGELLLEVALVVLQPLEQFVSARESAAEEHPRAATPAVMMTVMHVHLLSSYRSRKRAVRSWERRSASAQWSRSRSPAGVMA